MWFSSATMEVLKVLVKGSNRADLLGTGQQSKLKSHMFSELFVWIPQICSDKHFNFKFNVNRLKELFFFFPPTNSYSDFEADNFNSAGNRWFSFMFYCNKHATSRHHFLSPVLFYSLYDAICMLATAGIK